MPDLFSDSEEVEITPRKKFRIGKDLPSLEIDALHLLQTNFDVFSWNPVDLIGIDPSIIMQKLNVLPSSKPD